MVKMGVGQEYCIELEFSFFYRKERVWAEIDEHRLVIGQADLRA